LRIRTLIVIFLFSINFTIFSQEGNETKRDEVDETKLSLTENANNTPELGNNTVGVRDYLVVVFVLILVIAALYFVLKVIKKVGGNRVGLDNDLIHVISTKALKGTTALHLVEVGNQVFLIGATDNSINPIAEITDKETRDMISLNLSSDNVPQTSFFQFFSDKLKSNNIEESSEQATPKVQTNKDKLDRY